MRIFPRTWFSMLIFYSVWKPINHFAIFFYYINISGERSPEKFCKVQENTTANFLLLLSFKFRRKFIFPPPRFWAIVWHHHRSLSADFSLSACTHIHIVCWMEKNDLCLASHFHSNFFFFFFNNPIISCWYRLCRVPSGPIELHSIFFYRACAVSRLVWSKYDLNDKTGSRF